MDKVTTGESRSKEVGNGALETAGEPGWMQGKSQMLDEVTAVALGADTPFLGLRKTIDGDAVLRVPRLCMIQAC